MEKIINDKELKEIIKLFESGKTKTSIAAMYYCSSATIGNKIKDYYKSIGKEIPHIKRTYENKKDKKIIALHKSGKMIKEIAEVCECTRQTVRNRLKEYYDSINEEFPKKNDDQEKIVKLYEAGTSKKELVKQFGYSYVTINKKINDYYIATGKIAKKEKVDSSAIIEQFEKGKTRHELADMFGCSYYIVCNRIKKHYNALNKNKVTEKRDTVMEKEIVKLYEKGLTCGDISKIYNCSKQNINYKLQRYYSEQGIEKPENKTIKFEKEDLINKTYKDMTIEEVSEKIKCKPNALSQKINRICREFNLTRQDYILTNWEKENKIIYDEIIRLYEKGYTQTELAKVYYRWQTNIGRMINNFYKTNNLEKPSFLTKMEIKTYFKRNSDLFGLDTIAEKKNKKVPTKKVIDALKEYRKEIYLYYLDNTNINRYNLENTLEKEQQKINQK